MDDVGKILADFSMEMGKQIVSETAGSARSKKYSIANALGVSINRYADKIYQSCSKTKTLLYADKAVDIKDIYVQGLLHSQTESVNDGELLSRVLREDKKNIVISGTAGSGKSMMMKHFLLQSIRIQSKKIPIFFELRTVNKAPTVSLLDHLFKKLDIDAKQFPRKRFDDCLQRGMFIFILDGFDELDEDLVEKIELELRELYQKYSQNSLIISTRPDVKLSSSVSLEVYHVQKLSLNQAVSLIEKVRYDADKKEAFISELKSGLYTKHHDFASSPLLLTMMLMTFHTFAVIPEKIHLFYNQVFEVLFSKHDVSKDGYYVRSTKTSLDIDDFSEILQAFSSSSYVRKCFQFTLSSALEYSEDAIKYCGQEVEKKDFLEDMLKAVCLLIKDGNRILFTHRSFQEYFTALFISNLREENFVKFVKAIEGRASTDDVLFMLFGMEKDKFETLVLLDLISSLKSELRLGSDEIDSELSVLDLLFEEMIYSSEGKDGDHPRLVEGDFSFGATNPDKTMSLSYNLSEQMWRLMFLVKCYPAEFEWLDSNYMLSESLDEGDYPFFITGFLACKLPVFKDEKDRTEKEIAELIFKSNINLAKNIVHSLDQIKEGIAGRSGFKNNTLQSLLG